MFPTIERLVSLDSREHVTNLSIVGNMCDQLPTPAKRPKFTTADPNVKGIYIIIYNLKLARRIIMSSLL